jgi:hypothetical protein
VSACACACAYKWLSHRVMDHDGAADDAIRPVKREVRVLELRVSLPRHNSKCAQRTSSKRVWARGARVGAWVDASRAGAAQWLPWAEAVAVRTMLSVSTPNLPERSPTSHVDCTVGLHLRRALLCVRPLCASVPAPPQRTCSQIAWFLSSKLADH